MFYFARDKRNFDGEKIFQTGVYRKFCWHYKKGLSFEITLILCDSNTMVTYSLMPHKFMYYDFSFNSTTITLQLIISSTVRASFVQVIQYVVNSGYNSIPT